MTFPIPQMTDKEQQERKRKFLSQQNLPLQSDEKETAKEDRMETDSPPNEKKELNT
jgi:hypothetical protein